MFAREITCTYKELDKVLLFDEGRLVDASDIPGLRSGMTRSEVWQVLGKSDSTEVVSLLVAWAYSRPAVGEYSDHWQRLIIMDEEEKKVVRKVSQYHATFFFSGTKVGW
jgi:hypothetical protein